MGRPRLNPDRKLVPVKVTLSPARFDELSQQAFARDIPLAAVVRELVDPAFREPKTKSSC